MIQTAECSARPLGAFILAAGRGERLRPITNSIPKPLLPILGRTVLERVLERVFAVGIVETGVNVHHLGPAFREWIGRSPYRDRVTILQEKELLGTGGGIRNAMVELCAAGGDLLVHNGDILSDTSLETLIDFHRQRRPLVSLCVRDFGPANTLMTDARGLLAGVAKTPQAQGRSFAGIAVYDREFIRFLPEGVSHVVDAWLRAIEEGGEIALVPDTGSRWIDIGTPDAYADEVFRCLDERGRRIYAAGVLSCEDMEIRGHLVVEAGGHIPQPVTVRDVIVLPDGRVPGAERIEDCIVGAGFTVPIRRRLAADGGRLLGKFRSWKPFEPWSGDENRESGRNFPEIEDIGLGGSLRRFCRVSSPTGSVVIVMGIPGDPEIARYRDVAEWARAGGVRVPRVFGAEKDSGRMLLEDLGDRSVFEWLNCRPSVDRVRGIYREILRMAALLHSLEPPPSPRPPSDLAFDEEYFMWESGYFIEHFVGRFCPALCRAAADPAVAQERRTLAAAGGVGAPSVIHRDLQSQNVMLVGKGLSPVLIDIQGARLGPAAYDVASLLWDPYTELPEEFCQELLVDYLRYREAVDPSFDRAAFRETLLPCRLQRHMQALGAYGFLSGVRGYSRFKAFIPAGVRLLALDAAEAGARWPALTRLILSCAHASYGDPEAMGFPDPGD